jgi:cell division protein FtsB
MYGKAEESRVAHADSATALQGLRDRKTAVEGSLAKLSTERGVEEEIRLRYQLAKPGEEQIVLVAREKEASSTNVSEDSSFWSWVTGWFGR